MIFIAGVSPKTKALDQNPRRCPVCGLNQAYYKRIDHYLSLFFIPVLRVKKGEPFIACERCERTIHEFGPEYAHRTEADTLKCRYCAKSVGKNYKFCPHCGSRI